MFKIFFILSTLVVSAQAAQAAQLNTGLTALQKMQGCYLIDYSYTETESLKAGYQRDNRVYDVNVHNSVKEWIYTEYAAPNRIRLQHILFATHPDGSVIEGSELRHQVEEWEFNARFLYDFSGPSKWEVKDLTGTPELWTRKVTNLDSGLRYQCAAQWSEHKRYSEWSCANYAPIPGREIRDMGRKDYNSLDRKTRVIVYDGSWLERQDNIKTIHGTDGSRTPLARELGKNWYVRLPDAECAPAQKFAKEGQAFGDILREVWDSILIGDRPFYEMTPAGSPPRFAAMLEIEEQFKTQDLSDPTVRQSAAEAVRLVIQRYRK